MRSVLAGIEAGWRRFALLSMALTGIVGGETIAAGPRQEDPAIRTIYADAVHAYFSRDFQVAYDNLTEAIAAGTADPRAWYFRGLAALEMGRVDEAEADFERAADMEAVAYGDWPVARSLERIQGRKRLALERHRSRARVAWLEEARMARQRRQSVLQDLRGTVSRPMLPERERPMAPEEMGGEAVDLDPPGEDPAEDALAEPLPDPVE